MKTELIGKKYRIIGELGVGGMGKVYKVSYKGKYFALKICLSSDTSSIQRFKREVRMMKSISHTNVIEIIDSNLNGTKPYFVMPLCKFSLADKLETLKAKPRFALKILKQICTGVNAIHLNEVVHRDIKPENILVDEDNVIKISDLGLGKFSRRDSTILTSSNVYMGTTGYIPPEFHNKSGTIQADVRSDVYQLGKLIYAIFTATYPIRIERDILPGGLMYIVEKCTSDEPDERYQSVNELKTALNSYLLSLNPNNNPISAFENQINVAVKNLESNEYEKKNIEKIVHAMTSFKDDSKTFFDQSKKIPGDVIRVIASCEPTLCRAYLKVYSPIVEKYFKHSHPDFVESESVASALFIVFKESTSISIKTLAMKTTLVTSVATNRYSAMGVFDIMIKSIKKDSDAFTVTEMLKENIHDYEEVSTRVARNNLHPYFQKLQDKIIQKRNNRKKEKSEW